jgi:hypothetical protein
MLSNSQNNFRGARTASWKHIVANRVNSVRYSRHRTRLSACPSLFNDVASSATSRQARVYATFWREVYGPDRLVAPECGLPPNDVPPILKR